MEGPSVITHLSSTQRCAGQWTKKVSSCPPTSPRSLWGLADPRWHRAKRQALRGEHADTSGMQPADTRVSLQPTASLLASSGGARARRQTVRSHRLPPLCRGSTAVFSKFSIRGFPLNATDLVSCRLTLKVLTRVLLVAYFLYPTEHTKSLK